MIPTISEMCKVSKMIIKGGVEVDIPSIHERGHSEVNQ